MLKRAAAMFALGASMAYLIGCKASTSERFLYAALPTANQINAYREDPNSGVLDVLSISPITAGQGVHSMVIHPSNKYLYTLNSLEDDVALYTLSSTGALTEMGTRTPTGTSPNLIAVDSAGAFLYVSNTGNSDSISSYSISSGVLAPVSGSPFPIGAQAQNMVLSPSGNFLYIAVIEGGSPGSIEIWSLNAGVLQTIVGIQPVGTTPSGMAIDSTGTHLYVSNFGDNSISEFTINSDGSLTPLDTVGAGQGVLSSPVFLLIDRTGKYMYVANQSSSTVVGFAINSDGSLSLLPSDYSIGTNAQPSFLAVDAAGHYLFVGNNANPQIQSFNLDTGSGVLTLVSSYPLGGNATTSIVLTP